MEICKSHKECFEKVCSLCEDYEPLSSHAVLYDVDKLLREYTQYLYDHGYLDDDWWAEQPSPILEFINKKSYNWLDICKQRRMPK
jgi:hypothetical protein